MSVVSSTVSAAKVDSVRLWRAPDHTRLVLDLNGPAEHNLFTLENPNRVVIDITKTAIANKIPDLPLGNTPIKQVRYGKHNNSDLRVVLDLRESIKPRSFFLKKHGEKPDRLVIDLHDLSKSNSTKASEPVVREETNSQRDIVVAVDAGHGGEDPGALGPNRIQEKAIVLAISKQLVRMIDGQKGFKAHLVRSGDYYIPLGERRDKARSLRADLFVSVHADAFKDHRARGASVFALSRKGASSESARFLAKKENEADLIGGVGGDVSLQDIDNVLAGVLVDLSMTATMTNSLEVGARVLRELGKVTHLHKKHVEQAGFAVLKSPDVPSILVETGFISNPTEANRLNTYAYRRKIATSIFKGITDYFDNAPPPGSYLAWQKANAGRTKLHKVARGDTLSGIAARYKVSMSTLMKANRLKSASMIRVGQRLTIPAS